MKTIAKLMALCMLLGTMAIAQAPAAGDKDKAPAAAGDKDKSKDKKSKKGKKDKKDKDKKDKDDKGAGDKK